LPFLVTPERLRLVARLTPRAGRDGLDGVATAPQGGASLRLRLWPAHPWKARPVPRWSPSSPIRLRAGDGPELARRATA